MTLNKPLNDIWLKSAILGCLWASSEIVLGSFLHNLHVPLGSNFLTAIGIILLISVSYKWKDKGLFWRSGLICALMKSVSPSAVIFGPMIAILSEALLLEFAVLIFRRNMFAYILGGILAMSWTFIHKISFFILAYGFNLISLYKEIAVFAQKQLNITFNDIWTPFYVLWSVYVLMGIISAVIGIYIGKKLQKDNEVSMSIKNNNQNNFFSKKGKSIAETSLLWLAFDIAGMIAVLFLMNFSGWVWWSSTGLIIIIIWAIRYRRALKPLKKPRFWILFVLITMLTSFLFTKFQNHNNDILSGLIIGLQMNLRAALIIIGFSAIGTELTNPVIHNFFKRSSFSQLPIALEVAFDTLPFVLANIPDFKDFFKKPVTVIQQVVFQADYWLRQVRTRQDKKQKIIIITGNIGQGKTTLLKEIVDLLKQKEIRTGGIISPRIFNDNILIGYNLIDAGNNDQTLFSRTSGDESMIRAGKYYFYNEGFEFGKRALAIENNKESQVIVIDEVGFLELDNKGWAFCLNTLIRHPDKSIILVVRNSLVDNVIKKWSISEPLIIETEHDKSKNILDIVFKHLNYNEKLFE